MGGVPCIRGTRYPSRPSSGTWPRDDPRRDPRRLPGSERRRPARSARVRRGSRKREGVALPRDGVRFLVDENLPRRFAEMLRAAGHDANHVAERNLAGATDETVMALAVEEHAVLVTYDADFAMLVLGELRFPSVVLLRADGTADRKRSRVCSSTTSNRSSTHSPKARSAIFEPCTCALELPITRSGSACHFRATTARERCATLKSSAHSTR